MELLISVLFIIEFFLILIILFYSLFKKGLNFKVGLSFAVIYFIFIPLFVMIYSGKLELSLIDFGSTSLKDVYLKKNIKTSFILIFFIFSIILFLYFPSLKKPKKNIVFKPSIISYLVIYIFVTLIIFIGSGLLEGGNWYDNRHDFYISYGSFALLLAFILNSSKILIISSITHKFLNDKIKYFYFLIFILIFSIIDMIFSGNRIYLFCTLLIIGLLFIKKNPIKTIIYAPIITPLIVILGYFISVFRHMRGKLFHAGIPSLDLFSNLFLEAVKKDPLNISSFLLGISESVNVNVIYNLFNTFDNFLYGATYLKSFVFFIPRSVWPSKPESITLITANEYGSVSLVTTIIGEMYMNFYLIGILILPFFLWIIDNLLSYTINKYGEISNVLMFVFGILIFRMPFSDELLVFVFCAIIIKTAYIIKNTRFKFKNNEN